MDTSQQQQPVISSVSSSDNHLRNNSLDIPMKCNDWFCIGISEKKGRGLFATTDIPALSILHTAPCIVVQKDEYEQHAKHTIFEHYLFNDVKTGNKLLALGYGSIFNHDSCHPNVLYHVNSDQQTITYKSSVRTIPKGTELWHIIWFQSMVRRRKQPTTMQGAG
jgi:SET domain